MYKLDVKKHKVCGSLGCVVPAFLSHSDLIDPIVQLGVIVWNIYGARIVRRYVSITYYIVVHESRVPPPPQCRYAMICDILRQLDGAPVYCVFSFWWSKRVVIYGFTALAALHIYGAPSSLS